MATVNKLKIRDRFIEINDYRISDPSVFITKSVDDLTNYYLKSDTYTKSEISQLIGSINRFHYEIHSSLDEIAKPAINAIYLIGPDADSRYEEYVYANKQFVKIGDTVIDLSEYITTDALNAILRNYTTIDNLAVSLANLRSDIYTKAEVESLINSFVEFHYEVVDTLPEYGIPNVIYLVGPTDNVYDQYLYINDWIKIGDTSVDLTSAVSFTVAQHKTAAEKTRARSNIGFVEISESDYDRLVAAGLEDADTIYLTLEEDV